MRLLKRLLRRVLVLGLGIFTVWLIAFVFRFTDSRLPTVLALAITYGVSAYIVLPRIVGMGLKALQRKRVPRFTITGDGLPGDPVNLVLTGTLQQLNAAFKLAGWSQADAPGRQHHWLCAIRICRWREMAGAAQADSSFCDPRRCYLRARNTECHRLFAFNPGRRPFLRR